MPCTTQNSRGESLNLTTCQPRDFITETSVLSPVLWQKPPERVLEEGEEGKVNSVPWLQAPPAASLWALKLTGPHAP